ncbi:MAG: hypothetical protein ACFFB2_05295 [Promethearchaeota archaeon]
MPSKIGKCSIKIQGKILVELADKNLPKIGAHAKIKRNNHFRKIGEVLEVIGSTRNPWVVISTPKSSFNMVRYEECIFTEDHERRRKIKNPK